MDACLGKSHLVLLAWYVSTFSVCNEFWHRAYIRNAIHSYKKKKTFFCRNFPFHVDDKIMKAMWCYFFGCNSVGSNYCLPISLTLSIKGDESGFSEAKRRISWKCRYHVCRKYVTFTWISMGLLRANELMAVIRLNGEKEMLILHGSFSNHPIDMSNRISFSMETIFFFIYRCHCCCYID